VWPRWLRHLADNEEIGGSNPPSPTCVRAVCSNIFIIKYRIMKKCIRCSLNKNEDEFYYQKRKLKENYTDRICKKCRQEESKINRNKTRDWLDSLRIPCIICNEKRTHLIDFHHLDPSQKDIEISKYSTSGGSNFETKKKKLEDELKKCVTLCSNCHRDFHFYEKNEGLKFEEYKSKNIL